eukprot:TRINITY_DN5927_c0_g1_i1.p1 TRINITY_DN5927_c0_g1~~TRINITY_DN5927_c0_g1_i1.p1  ORF type:complete len:144 (-),score=17.56 TRINITY_DN5927_c0_g1_i1:386-817(-)
MFLFVKEKKVVGCVIAESIQSACPVIPDAPNTNLENKTSERSSVVISSDSRKAVMGVSRIWVHPSFRNQKIASRILDSARYGTQISGASCPNHTLTRSQPPATQSQLLLRQFDSEIDGRSISANSRWCSICNQVLWCVELFGL